MHVANISIQIGRFSAPTMNNIVVGFSDLTEAKAKFSELSILLDRREKRANDMPKTVTIDGSCGTGATVPVEEICAIAFTDFHNANENEAGVRDKFPNLFKV